MSKSTTVSEYALNRSKQNDFFKRYGMVLIFVGPYLFMFLLFCIYPLIYGIIISFFKYDVSNPANTEWRGLKNFITILSNSNSIYNTRFWYAMKNTVVFAILIVPVSIIIPVIFAILINSQPKGYKLFRALIYLPSILPCSASGVIFIAMFGQSFGYVNQWIGQNINWLNGNPMTAWSIIFLLCLWGGWGGNFIIISAGLKNIDKNLYEAAAVDGCTGFRRTLAVTLPAIKNQLILCTFTTIIGYFGLYGQIYVLTNAGPVIYQDGQALNTTMSIMWYLQGLMGGKRYDVYGMTSAMGLLLGVFIGCVTALQLLLTRERKSGTKISQAYLKYIAEKKGVEQ